MTIKVTSKNRRFGAVYSVFGDETQEGANVTICVAHEKQRERMGRIGHINEDGRSVVLAIPQDEYDALWRKLWTSRAAELTVVHDGKHVIELTYWTDDDRKPCSITARHPAMTEAAGKQPSA